MSKIKRSAATGLILAAMAGGTLATTVSPASAATLHYHCKSSYKSIDNPGDWGPAPDNWDFTVKNCVARSGSYVYAKAKISWDGPIGGAKFDSDPYFRLYAQKSVRGNDHTQAYWDFNMADALARHDKWSNHNGSMTTGTIRAKVSKGKGYADGALKINWSDDDHRTRHYGFSGSPRV
ncbi:hypothetical protein [Streptomyces lydicus]|uniref:hypothetical protein n=1 Tax=Streptomyces lydicus TaxID=47763 RepID=UPI001010F973|nr:hypothetical protein [Streptomyces lydicus]MCZ1012074.1 hypothetical protein [Streptomyces lydicus]